MGTAEEERLARNEALFREVNERISQIAAAQGSDRHAYEFLCECSDPTCTARISLTLTAYEQIRAGPTRFVLAGNHLRSEIEHIVEKDEHYLVVEKDGLASDVAAALDPRAD